MSEAAGHEGTPAAHTEGPPAHADEARPGRDGTPVAPVLADLAGRFSPMQRLLVTVAAVVVVLLFMRIATGVLVPILLAMVVTMAVSPFLAWLIRHRVPPILAWLVTVILTTAAVVFVFVLGGIGIARLIGELSQYTDELAARLQDAVNGLDSIGLDLSGLTKGEKALLGPGRIIDLSIRLLGMVRQLLGGVALTLLIVFFMLAESITLQLKFSMTPPRVSPALARVELFTRDMRAFVQATAIIGLANGFAAGIFLWLLGIEFPLMWGVFAFVMSFIPTLGFFIAVLPPMFIALLDGGWQTALLVFIGYVVIYAVTGSLRSGRFVGRRLNLSPLVILLSIILWGWVLGLMGGLLAVPMTLFVRRLLVEGYDESRWITDLLGRPVRTEPGAPPPGPGPHAAGPSS
jgi:predicted PurR-regulated permease PerM